MANEMRDRLVELLVKDDIFDECECGMCTRDNYCVRCGAEILADHLIENGVIVPPCKVGDVVYFLCRDHVTYDWYICEKKVYSITRYDNSTHIYVSPICSFVEMEIGKRVFLTKDQAEQKLKEMRGGNDL